MKGRPVQQGGVKPRVRPLVVHTVPFPFPFSLLNLEPWLNTLILYT